MQTEATFTKPRPDCDTTRWHAPDVMASEDEVSQFLAALCVVLRPRHVLETGTYHGHTAAAMGTALRDYGHLDTIEIDEDDAAIARAACIGLPVTIHVTHSLAFEAQVPYELMFFDSAIEDREKEMRRFRNRGAVWVLHDTQDQRLINSLARLQADHVISPPLDLDTPRGLALGVFL